MKWVYRTVIIFLIITIIVCLNFLILSNNAKKEKNNTEEVVTRNLIIKDGNIENESLLDEFINNTNENFLLEDEKLEIEYISTSTNTTSLIKIDYVPGKAEITSSDDSNVTVEMPQTEEEFKEAYGYYIVTRNQDEESVVEHDAYNWKLTRQIDEETNAVGIVFINENATTDNIDFLCSYFLNSSNYREAYKLTFNQRKDNSLIKVCDAEGYGIYTLGGDARVTIDDEELLLQDAISQNKLSADKILEQINLDEEYSICSTKTDKEYGYTEYYYDGYTILKCDSDDLTKDIIIGKKGSIISDVNTSKTLLFNK